MKTFKLLVSVLLTIVFAQGATAKNQKMGLYLTVEDYINHKLSYATDGSSDTKIRLNSMFESGKVVVMHGGKKEAFSKSAIFGFRDNDQDYRFFNNSAFKIVDTGGFFIYCASKLVQQGKSPKPTASYYFSASPKNEIKPLTIDNLQYVFSKDIKFLYAVEGFFKSDSELTAYDANLKEYKLKYLFAQTVR